MLMGCMTLLPGCGWCVAHIHGLAKRRLFLLYGLTPEEKALVQAAAK